jgi:DNA-binding transcriptional ArsR family regulator
MSSLTHRGLALPAIRLEFLHKEEKILFMSETSSYDTSIFEDWAGEGGNVDLTSLAILASSRVDAMFLRFRLLSVLLESPLSKVDALALLGISRPYLDQILNDWMSLKTVDVRDVSPQHFMKPKMSIYLVKRPVISITRLDSDVEKIYGLSDIKEILLAIMSQTRRSILSAISDGSLSVKELGEKVQRGDIYKHIRVLLKARLLFKLKAPSEESKHRKLRVVVKRNYKSIGFSLEPYAYR